MTNANNNVTVHLDTGAVRQIVVDGQTPVRDLLTQIEGISPGKITLAVVGVDGAPRTLDGARDADKMIRAGETVYATPKGVGGAAC